MAAPRDAPALLPDTPIDGLELEWVHGYRGHDSRNNLRYSAEGRVVYPAAGLGVSLHVPSFTQKFCSEHSDEVLCLAAHPSLKYMATGQMGRKPSIVVWDAETGETTQVMVGFHRRAVSQLAFSPDGRLLASIGADDQHSLAVYEWRRGLLKAWGVTSGRKVLGLAWDPSSSVVLECGLKHVAFYELQGRNLGFHKGIIGRKGVSQAFLAAAYVGKQPVVATADGHVYVFENYTLEKTVKAHESAVYALHPFDSGVFTGGKDGLIKKWSVDWECVATFDTLLNVNSCLRPRVRSLCLSPDKKRLLVGTAGNEVFELSAFNGSDGHNGPLVGGSFRGQTWGLALHPQRPEVATIGDDGAVRVFSLDSRRALLRTVLESGGRAIAYSPNGKHLVVGLGRGKKNDRHDGGFVVLDADKLSVLHEARDAAEWIRVARFTPDGQTLALGSEDTRVYLYNVKDMYSKRHVITSHRAPVTHVDFSADSLYLQSADRAGALVYTDLVTGINIPSPLTVKDVAWKSWTLPYGWPVQGLWPTKLPSDGSSPLCVARSEDKKLLAVGDSFGRLRLYNYPLAEENAGFRRSRGHGPEVRGLVWSRDDGLLLSVGGKDMCVMQWRHVADATPESGDEAKEEDDLATIEVDGGLLNKEDPRKDPLKDKPPPQGWDGKWLKAIVAPTAIPPETSALPPVELELVGVAGVRAEDVRNGVRYNAADDVVWAAGAVGVVHDLGSNSQTFFAHHRHDIISLAMSHDGRYVATGEAAAAPRVRVWDAAAGVEIAELPLVHTKGVSILAFSRDGKVLASVGQDEQHSVAVYRTYSGLWADARRVACERSTRAKLLFGLFCGPQSFPLMLGGVRTVHFLSLEGKSLRLQRGVFGQRRKIQPLLCGVHLAGQDIVVTGAVSGHLYVWKDRTVSKVQPAHTGSIYALAQAELGVVSGGKDGLVKMWDRDLNVLKQFNLMEGEPLPYSPCVHSVCTNRAATKLLVGLRGGEVWELAIVSGKRLLVTEGHSRRQLRGLVVNPANADQYATMGDDGVLRLWSVSQRRVVKRLKLDGSCRALAWAKDGKHLALGFGGSGGDTTVTSKDGAIMVLDSDLEVVHEERRSKLSIADLKFSPNGATLAVGSEDGRVYLHDVAKQFALRASSGKSNDEVRWMDWSEDGTVLQVGTGEADLALIDANDGARLAALSSHRDTRWETITCPYGWYVQGIWPRLETPGYDVLSVDRSHDERLLAVSTVDGDLRVYAYPVQTMPNKPFLTVRGHGQMATKARFTADDSHLISLDGYSGTIFTYRVLPLGKKAVEAQATAKE